MTQARVSDPMPRGAETAIPGGWRLHRLRAARGADAWLLACALSLCACVLFWVAWQKLRPFWLDEAMLLLAIERIESFAGLFRPLPLYDQGLPTGLVLIAWALHKAALPLFTQKLLPILAGAATLPVLVAAARRSGFGMTATAFCIFMLVASSDYSFQFGNFKQYAFETLAVALVLLAAVSGRRACAALVVAACVLSLFFTFVTPVILVMLPFLYRRMSTPVLAGAIALLALGFAAAYVVYLKSALQFALSNYQYGFRPGFLPRSPRAVGLLVHVFMSHMPTIAVRPYDFRRFCTLLSLLGAAVALARRERIGLMFAAVVLVVSALSMLHSYLLGEGRYSGYLLAFLVLLAGRGVQAIVAAPRSWRTRLPARLLPGARLARQAALLLLVGFGLSRFVQNGAWFVKVGALPYAALAAADAARPDAIVPLGLGQPQIELARRHMRLDTRRFVEVNPAAAMRLPDQEVLRRPPDLFEKPGAWPLFMRAEQVHLRWLDTTTVLEIDDYYGWLLRQAELLRKVVFIAPTCLGPPDVQLDGLMRRLAEAGTMRQLATTPCYSTVLWTRAEAAPEAGEPGAHPI